MALQVTNHKRIFKFGKKELADPNSAMTPDEVRKHYSGTYPELTNASITGPKIEAGNAVFSISESVGTKG